MVKYYRSMSDSQAIRFISDQLVEDYFEGDRKDINHDLCPCDADWRFNCRIAKRVGRMIRKYEAKGQKFKML